MSVSFSFSTLVIVGLCRSKGVIRTLISGVSRGRLVAFFFSLLVSYKNKSKPAKSGSRDSRDLVFLFFIVAIREPLCKEMVLNHCHRGCCQAFETCQRKVKSETCDLTSRTDGEAY